jgi:hypothetical protein
MKFVESYSDKDFAPNVEEKIFDKNGDEVNSKKSKVFAKYLETKLHDGSKQFKYLIATFNNVPYDPKGIDSHRESGLDIKLKSVNKQAFDYYLLYLKTKNGLYMTRTQRSYINV